METVHQKFLSKTATCSSKYFLKTSITMVKKKKKKAIIDLPLILKQMKGHDILMMRSIFWQYL